MVIMTARLISQEIMVQMNQIFENVNLHQNILWVIVHNWILNKIYQNM